MTLLLPPKKGPLYWRPPFHWAFGFWRQGVLRPFPGASEDTFECLKLQEHAYRWFVELFKGRHPGSHASTPDHGGNRPSVGSPDTTSQSLKCCGLIQRRAQGSRVQGLTAAMARGGRTTQPMYPNP